MNMDLFFVGLAILLAAGGAIAALAAFGAMFRRSKETTVADLSGNNGYFLGFFILMPWMMPTKSVTFTYRSSGFTFLLGAYGLVSCIEAAGGGYWLTKLPVSNTLRHLGESSFGPTVASLFVLLIVYGAFIFLKSTVISTLDHWENPVDTKIK